MKQIAIALFAAAAVAAAAVPAAAQQPQSLVARIAASEDAVKSYTADVAANINLKSLGGFTVTPTGTFYHKGDRDKLVFTGGVPFMAQQFNKLQPNFPHAAQWQNTYAMSVENAGGGYTTLKLVPRKSGRIDHIDAKIDERTADVVSLRFNYNDGGYASLDQTYSDVQGHRLVTAVQGRVEVPHYSADWTTHFSNFHLNAAVPDSVFE